MVLTAHDFDLVSHNAIFGGFEPQLTQRIIESANVVRFMKHQALVRQGDIAPAFFIILDGWIKLYRSSCSGDESIIDVLTSGETVALGAAMIGTSCPVTAEAITSGRVLRLPIRQLLRCIEEMPEIAVNVITMNSYHIVRLMLQVEQLKSQSGVQRVASFLASLCPVLSGSCVAVLPYTKVVIAGRLGIKPETLSRAINKLKCIGVKVCASHVVVRDIQRLRRFAFDELQYMAPLQISISGQTETVRH